MKILLTGGGTAGSVSPLLAVYSELQRIDCGFKKSDFLWLGTNNGPEKKMAADYGLKFKPIFAGKLRRYLDLRNVIDLLKIILAFCQSIFIILKFKPDVILSAGSFVSVPVVWAGWLLGRDSLIHQQDIRPGLANKLMAPFAARITVTFEESLKHFSKKKVLWTGNPVREEILRGDKQKAIKKLELKKDVPSVLVMGGGTGSAMINEVISKALPRLIKFCQIVHLTGGRTLGGQLLVANGQSRYHPLGFLNVHEMADAYVCADIAVSRCGLSSLTELSALGKPTIFIPLADTHQEDNAKLILEKKAGVVIWKKELGVDKLVKMIKDILSDTGKQKVLSNNISKIMPAGSAEKQIRLLLSFQKGGNNARRT